VHQNLNHKVSVGLVFPLHLFYLAALNFHNFKSFPKNADKIKVQKLAENVVLHLNRQLFKQGLLLIVVHCLVSIFVPFVVEKLFDAFLQICIDWLVTVKMLKHSEESR